MSRRASLAIGTAILVVLGCGAGVAAGRGGGDASASADLIAPLSTADRSALAADHQLVESLPGALAEVPRAAADAARVDAATARSELAGNAALHDLAEAAEGRSAAVSLLVSDYRELLAGRPLHDVAAMPQALASLQAIEGDIVPAVRVVAFTHGRRLTATAAYEAVAGDHRAPELARLLADWSQAYGVLVLMEQKALG
ncbi:MAG TPA: hypothetical protein VHB69_01245 [Mycobacteriales bacterium]|nr:hypothetical protein [Mycobacteriales bacterium]